ncbi:MULTISPECIES: GyrI-like domain-containing protein [unclassified Fusibacter]|uniref:GyrI-like domain-containing protein n=1 Tax=unclassified Fusibacter TaxID=2624464 RepID=UPI0010132162|nr:MULTISPECIES: GyrI-like domain-containing protein [unclassified Fusibacter]MCK8061598.1 GyrI-like domain-containing protein [Fusibacter sp. A2]NPE23781.1 hypothetical protein [Fusibacter sp. A1]RXV58686.1 hypothetical protein DWB64_18510 [Fusibacter sp. A1]
MKHEWRKHEKEIYLPKKTPQVIDLKSIGYFTLKGEGNPNDPFFADYIQALYAVSYAVKMSYKSDDVPQGYYDYAVYPLEGVWDLKDKAKGAKDKDNLVFELMIRQPDFLTEDLAKCFIEKAYASKKLDLIKQVEFKTITDGLCVQMLHLGSYDDEPASFDLMQAYCKEHGLTRISMTHREIYLTDARKTSPDKQKTVLRFKVE